jgi:hypothetical protein
MIRSHESCASLPRTSHRQQTRTFKAKKGATMMKRQLKWGRRAKLKIPLGAIWRVISYLYAVELEDFEEHIRCGGKPPRNHVFRHILKLLEGIEDYPDYHELAHGYRMDANKRIRDAEIETDEAKTKAA